MKKLATNRRAKFDYDISEKLLAGVVLTGAEVKSIKLGHISLKGSHVALTSGELFLINANVSPYKYGAGNFEATRSRKLLVHKRQLARLAGLKQAGMAIFPLSVGTERGLVKVEIGVGRGRKRFDKRQLIRKRQADREMARVVHSKRLK